MSKKPPIVILPPAAADPPPEGAEPPAEVVVVEPVGAPGEAAGLALERPIDVKIGPDGAMYVLDFAGRGR